MTEQWQDEEASVRRYDREQADLERQTDALVLKSLTSLVTAAEDLKARLRRDTDSLLEEFRRNKRGLENDISMADAERQRLRRDADDERDRILRDARETADRIVREAEAERESLLGEVRGMEHRLRALESQILQVLGATGTAAAPTPPAPEDPPASRPSFASPESPSSASFDRPMSGAAGVAPEVAPPPSASAMMASAALASATLASTSTPTEPPASSRASIAPDEESTAPMPVIVNDYDDDDDDRAPTPAAAMDTIRRAEPEPEPEPADHLEASVAPLSREPLSREPDADEDADPLETARADDAGSVPVAAPPLGLTPEPERDAEPIAPAVAPPTMAPPDASTSATSQPAASAPTPASEPRPSEATVSDEPAPAARRALQLVFDGVPGYQQAASIERAVGDLADDGDVEIIEFEQGQLVLQVDGTDPRALADRLIAKPPLPMRLVASGQDNATFQLTAG